VDRQVEIKTERDVLKRIVALLFSFADLAERASGRSYPIRCLVLWALRRAEAVARDWVMAESSDDMQLAAACAVLHRNSRAEAMHLAQNFRALAHTLKRQLHLEEQFARRLMRGKRTRSKAGVRRRSLIKSINRLAQAMHVAVQCLRHVAFQAAPHLDTS
jgi:hypothetical protein